MPPPLTSPPPKQCRIILGTILLISGNIEMGERGRHMKVIEKTQNVVKGANNVKKRTNKQTIKLTFFRKAQVGGR